jgi:putative membrane protein
MQITKIPYLTLLAAIGIASAASLSPIDKQFMISAAKTDMTKAHEGQMAETQGRSDDVKNFAKTLVQDHTNSYTQLSELAAKEGVSIPKGINASRNPSIRLLVHLTGQRFDQAFTKDEIATERQTIAAFKREVAHGKDSDVKAYASKMIPVLERHLQLAEACARTKHG